MDSKHNGVPEREQRLDEVVLAYLKAMEAGQQPDRQELLDRHADLLPDLAQFFEDADALGGLALRPRSVQSDAALTCESVSGTIAEGKELGDFRIVREVGKGGMGIVYEAEQLSLRRRVALKVLPFAATMDPRHLQRFHNEAQAAACLHHTNIVPVHFVGCERGVHFYAMQFIDGQPLSEIIRQLRRAEKAESVAGKEQTAAYPLPPEVATQTSPTTRPVAEVTPLTSEGRRGRDYYRKAAELVVQAAEALDHAHQLGIVHRDVKPANLLLDARGNLWVTDFGLAQMQSDTRLTLTGDVVGTLRYMSPEQALAKRLVLDHRTDVYSLGVTLYELLTLRPAFPSEDRQELLRQIAFEEPAKPRRLERTIPEVLETIVLKAMEKQPQDRYATAQEMADDLRHWLDNRPIRARRSSWWVRLSKWMRRRPALAGLVAVSTLSVLGLVIGLLWHNLQLREAAHREQQLSGKAARQRDAARRAVDDMYTQVAEKWLAPQPRLQPIQREFLEKALHYYQEATETDDDSPQARLELGRSYLRVGSIQTNFGDNARAEQAFRRAIDVLQALKAERPDEAEVRALLALVYSSLSHVLVRVGDNPQAEQVARGAIAIFKQLKDEGLATRAESAHLADSYVKLGNALERTRGPREAEEAYRKALRILEDLSAESSADPNHQMALVNALQNLSAALYGTQQFKLAQEALERGVQHAERAVKSDSTSGEYRAKLALLQQSLGVVYCRTNQPLAAKQSLRRAQQMQARLVDEYPDFTKYKEELAATYNVLGNVCEAKEAEEAYRESIKIKVRLAADSPSVPYYRLDLVQSLNNLTGLLTTAGRMQQATRANAEARQHAEQLIKDFPGVADHQKALARTYQRRADIELAMGRVGAAAAEWKQALEVSSDSDIRDGAAQFLAQCPDPKYRDLAQAVELARENVRVAPENYGYWETLGLVEYRAGHAAEAVRAMEQAVRLGSTEPEALLLLAMARWAMGDRDRARRDYDAAREQIKKSGDPDAETQALLAEAAAMFSLKERSNPPEKH